MPSPVARQAILLSGTAVKPVWQANFLTASSLPAGLTYTKSGSIPATLFDSTGKLTYGGNNLILQSQTLSTSPWSTGGVSTLTPGITAPDGTSTAFQITYLAGGSRITQQIASIPAPSLIYSVYLKVASVDNGATLLVYDNTAGSSLTSLTVNTIAGSGIDAGNGWRRVYLALSPIVGHNLTFYVYTDKNNGAIVGSSLYAWGAQVEAVTYQTTPSAYNATTSAAYYAPRFDYDPSTLSPAGLLVEEQRVNLILQSKTGASPWSSDGFGVSGPTVTANSVVAPDGTTSGTKLVYPAVSTGGNFSVYDQSYTATAASYTDSIWLRGDVGGEQIYIMTVTGLTFAAKQRITLTTTWTRYTITATKTAATYYFQIGCDLRDGTQTSTSAQTVYAWGGQGELGAFATSYIPTAASTVTRTADVVSGANYNATQGSIIAEFAAYSPATAAQKVFSLSPVAQGKYLAAGTDGSAGWYNTGLQLSTGSANTPIRIGITYNSTGLFTAASNGASAYLASSASDYTGGATRFGLGDQTASGQFLNGWLRSIATYNVPMAKAPLQSRVVIGAPY